jgi:hypothetical protein
MTSLFTAEFIEVSSKSIMWLKISTISLNEKQLKNTNRVQRDISYTIYKIKIKVGSS